MTHTETIGHNGPVTADTVFCDERFGRHEVLGQAYSLVERHSDDTQGTTRQSLWVADGKGIMCGMVV